MRIAFFSILFFISSAALASEKDCVVFSRGAINEIGYHLSFNVGTVDIVSLYKTGVPVVGKNFISTLNISEELGFIYGADEKVMLRYDKIKDYAELKINNTKDDSNYINGVCTKNYHPSMTK